MNNSYHFYFDESYPTRHIKINANGELNIEKSNKKGMENIYVGCFVGWAEEYINSVEQQYEEFETKFLWKFDGATNGELKSERVKDKQYEYGIASFNKNSLVFYSEFFQFLKNTQAIYQISVVDKIELFLRKAIGLCHFYQSDVSHDSVFWSLIRFYELYATDDLKVAIVSFVNDKIDAYSLRKAFKNCFDDFIIKFKGNRLYESDIKACRKFKRIINKCCFEKEMYPVKFDYNYDAINLFYCVCMCKYSNSSELSIQGFEQFRHSVFVEIDRGGNDGENVYSFISPIFTNSCEVNSECCFGVRIADLLAGFFGRILFSISKTIRRNINCFDDQYYVKHNVLPNEWFDFKEDVFNFYIRIASYIVGKNMQRCSFCMTIYSDEIIVFITLLNYITQFVTFSKYSQISCSEHASRFNKILISCSDDLRFKLRHRFV